MRNTVTFNNQPTDYSAWFDNDESLQDLHFNYTDARGREYRQLDVNELLTELLAEVGEARYRHVDDQMYYIRYVDRLQQYITYRIYDEKRAEEERKLG